MALHSRSYFPGGREPPLFILISSRPYKSLAICARGIRREKGQTVKSDGVARFHRPETRIPA